MMKYLDIHTHQVCLDPEVDSRVSYRPHDLVLSDGYYSIGLHPCYEEDMTEDTYALLHDRVEVENRLWAIGECGLDKTSPVDMQTQIDYFRRQVELSERLELPVVIHCVRAYNELMELKKAMKPNQAWIIHGFRRNEQTAAQLIKAGLYLSFGQYFNPKALVLAHNCQRAFLETDVASIGIADVYQQAEQVLGQTYHNPKIGSMV